MKTDCKSEIGITVGLIDSLITISRILAKRNLELTEVKEALEDLHSDEDATIIMRSLDNIQDRKIIKDIIESYKKKVKTNM